MQAASIFGAAYLFHVTALYEKCTKKGAAPINMVRSLLLRLVK